MSLIVLSNAIIKETPAYLKPSLECLFNIIMFSTISTRFPNNNLTQNVAWLITS